MMLTLMMAQVLLTFPIQLDYNRDSKNINEDNSYELINQIHFIPIWVYCQSSHLFPSNKPSLSK